MTPEELINLSLQYEVEIEASTTVAPMELLTFSFKGCSPLKVTRAPLFLALHLRSLNFCSIKTPPYLTKEFLESLIEKERVETNFVEVPEFIFEHAHFFTSGDMESSLCELRAIRMNKIWKGLGSMDGRALYINGMTRWEFNEFRDIILGTMRLGKTIEAVENEE